MKPSISFIGAGKVGTALGQYFKQNGFEIQGYLSRSEASAIKAASITHSKSYTSLEKLISESNTIWITTPDDQIKQIVQQIANVPTSNNNHKLVIHTSGVHNIDILTEAQEAGYHVAVAHPLLAFGNPEDSVRALASTWFAIEEKMGNNNLRISNILQICCNYTFKIDKSKKALYHAAACMLSNYMVTLANAAQEMFDQAGLPKAYFARATMPLMKSVMQNLMTKEPKDALTGPIKRGDAETVKQHIEILQQEMPQWEELYKDLGRETMKMINDDKLKDILD